MAGEHIPKVTRVHLQLAQYPILGDVMRDRMRQELYKRGIITRERFEAEAREKAILSQKREGIVNPYREETAEIWERRLTKTRDNLTEFYFAYNLDPTLFEEIVRNVLHQRPTADEVLTLNPEMASLEILFQQMEKYAALPPDQQARIQHNMQETKVVLIKALISDDLEFVRVAKEYLSLEDLRWIRRQRVGRGKIGGKAAGLVLAWKILESTVAREPGAGVVIPQTYFVGADVSYEFLNANDLVKYLNQKYKSLDDIERDYPAVQADHAGGRFSDEIVYRFQEVLEQIGDRPLIVRSSSLLEDNFEVSFAGMYESVFCPNQGTTEENLAALVGAIKRVYASIYNPDVLLYRKQRGFLDFDERMAVIIQAVQGERYHDRYFPSVAGVAYSRNPFVWNQKLKREDGFARLVMGLGTRAVERVGEDYPRMVALSHPQLRPESGVREIRHYSQYYIDSIDLGANQLETRPIREVIGGDYPGLRYLASVDRGEYMSPMVFTDRNLDPSGLVVTLDGLLTQTSFAPQLRAMLKALEFGYGRPVDVEFTVSVGSEYPRPSVEIQLLQCRPLSGEEVAERVRFPERLPESDILFGTVKLVPTGSVRDIRYIVYVDPSKYSAAGPSDKMELARLISRINQRLEGQVFVLMGPGRWGSSNPDLGLRVGYADFYNTKALVELGWRDGAHRPTLSFGTHFFQDLVESHIFPLAVYPGEPGNPFNDAFFAGAPNALPALLPADARFAGQVKVIDVAATTGGRLAELVMSGDEGKALAYLGQPDAPLPPEPAPGGDRAAEA
jgi:hypothetical protein